MIQRETDPDAPGAGYLLGIDVGTGSARAGLFDAAGRMAGSGRSAIAMFREGGHVAEQSGAGIWAAVAAATRAAMREAGVGADQVRGIGFDATCSLVVLGEGGQPLPVGDPAVPERNIIVWMDHRAVAQAERINAMGHPVLAYVGGRISPEMQTPKLLWLKENRAEVFDRAWQFMDLTDFLTWRATGSLARSNCTVTCKWTYVGHQGGWDDSYFHAIGLGGLAQEGFARIGTEVVDPGTPLGGGLTEDAARDLGLRPGTPVGAGLIDAHAGGIGSVGPRDEGGPEANLAYVFGTSSCTMTTTAEPVFVPGVWGPYRSAMVPGTWLNEGGQSAAGAAIEQLLAHHPHAAGARAAAEAAGLSLPDWLAEQALSRADAAAGGAAGAVHLAAGVHVVPEFLGNRAPHADPATRAVIAGLGMERGLDSLVALYVAGLCGLGYGLRQIVTAQGEATPPGTAGIARIVVSGGAGRSPLVRQILADATGLEVAAPAAEEPVLLGAAILGAVAAGLHPGIPEAMARMSAFAGRYHPAGGEIAALHERRFQLFTRFQALAREAAQG